MQNPGDHIELDIDDPRAAKPENVITGTPSIIDLNAELAKLTMFRGMTPQSTMEERRGSGASLASYRDGVLFAGRFAGTCHWETHPADELVHILDGAATRRWFAMTDRRDHFRFAPAPWPCRGARGTAFTRRRA